MTETNSALDGPRAPAADRVSRPPRVPISASLLSREWLSSTMVRLVLGGPDLARFEPSPHADSYVKILFLADGVAYDRPLDLTAIRQTHPSEHQPRLRTYTVRAWNAADQELTIDVIVHGPAGLGGPWAASAEIGDSVLLLGPGGGFSPSSDAPWHLLIGDESALPAIAVALERLPATAIARVFIEIADASSELPIPRPSTARLRWVHRGAAPVGQHLLDEVARADWPAGAPDAFVHGEAGTVRQFRRLLKPRWGVDPSSASISGYWRLGADDERWRAQKADWNRAQTEEEAVTD